jgi:hypothetical protein
LTVDLTLKDNFHEPETAEFSRKFRQAVLPLEDSTCIQNVNLAIMLYYAGMRVEDIHAIKAQDGITILFYIFFTAIDLSIY